MADQQEPLPQPRLEDVRKLVQQFENACAGYWINDRDERISDRRLRELDAKMRERKAALMAALDNFVTRSEITSTLDDGFGNVWEKCGPCCGLEIVRPGKAQCTNPDCANKTHAADNSIAPDRGPHGTDWTWSLDTPEVSGWRWIETWDENDMEFKALRFHLGDQLAPNVTCWRYLNPPKGSKA